MTIQHARGCYDVQFVGFDDLLAALPEEHVVVSDDNVLRHWVPEGSPHVFSIEPGEAQKNLTSLGQLLESFANSGATRGSSVVALGGGVVGDLAGFAAASYMRGVPFIQVPTTLLAMVDSSVGGKVGVDLKAGKNLAGAFHAPDAVYIALETLATLPERQFVNGTAEVWKAGCILDADLFTALESEPLRPGDSRLEYIVRRCIELKAGVVQADEFERTGARAILNFGHTVGHAIEQVSGYQDLHGEAVAQGMVVEARLGEALGITEVGTAERVEVALASQGLPVANEWLDQPDALLAAMARDKKAAPGALAFSLLECLGTCKLVRNVDPDMVRSALRPK